MRRFGTMLVLLSVLGLAFSPPVLAQVDVSLVSTQRSVQPGKSFTVALRMQHAPQWHSFWKNAGIGLPTRIQWDLPAGWHASPIQWPVPVLVRDAQGKISGHGYVGLLYLPIQLTPPADMPSTGSVELKGSVHWLMCKTQCVPGHKQVSLSLPVSSRTPQPDTAVQAALAKLPMPQSAADWKLAASHDQERVELHVVAPGAVNDLHFFPLNKFIAYRKPQTVAGHINLALLKIALDSDETLPPDARLRGVLAYTDAHGTYRGVRVDVPFVSADAAAAIGGAVGDNFAPGGIGGGKSGSLSLGIVLFALLGGLILNLMPCVFPVLGIKVLSFVDQAGENRRKVAAHAWAFTAGVLLSFWILAGVLAVLRAGGQQLGWGFQLQSAPFVFGLAVVMLVFALNLSGVFETGLRATSLGSKLQTRSGVTGSLFMGMLATIVATPCSAPFLAPALGVALVLPVGQSFVVFTAIALGLSLPYLLLSVFPQLIRWLPRPGPWMETFKQLMAFPLYASVGYLVWVLAGQTSANGLLVALLALSLIAMAMWVYGRIGKPGASTRRRWVALTGGGVLFVLALALGWPRPAPPTAVTWQPWSAERVAQLRQQGRGIYVDFTARWCATCQVNKRVVFGSAAVKKYFREHDIVALEADWTRRDPHITAELAKWQRSAVPFNLVYPAGTRTTRPVVLPEVLTPQIVLDAFRTPPGTNH